MARDFDFFPTYDILIKDQVYLSNIWSDFMTSFVESLREYLTSFGAVIPNITLSQRDSIQDPQEGQMIYVTDANAPATPRTAELQIWQVVAGVAGWTVIV